MRKVSSYALLISISVLAGIILAGTFFGFGRCQCTETSVVEEVCQEVIFNYDTVEINKPVLHDFIITTPEDGEVDTAEIEESLRSKILSSVEDSLNLIYKVKRLRHVQPGAAGIFYRNLLYQGVLLQDSSYFIEYLRKEVRSEVQVVYKPVETKRRMFGFGGFATMSSDTARLGIPYNLWDAGVHISYQDLKDNEYQVGYGLMRQSLSFRFTHYIK